MQYILCLGLNSDIKMAVAHQCIWYLNRHHASARLTLVVASTESTKKPLRFKLAVQHYSNFPWEYIILDNLEV